MSYNSVQIFLSPDSMVDINAILYREELQSGPRNHSMMIYCSACGTLIGNDSADEDGIYSKLRKRLHPEPYKTVHRRRRQEIRCAAKEVEKIVFNEHPWGWEALYRLSKLGHSFLSFSFLFFLFIAKDTINWNC